MNFSAAHRRPDSLTNVHWPWSRTAWLMVNWTANRSQPRGFSRGAVCRLWLTGLDSTGRSPAPRPARRWIVDSGPGCPRLSEPSPEFFGKMDLTHAVGAHGGISGRQVKLAGICLGDVRKQLGGGRALAPNECLEPRQQDPVTEVGESVLAHECDSAGTGRRGRTYRRMAIGGALGAT